MSYANWFFQTFKPKERLNIADWADKYRILPRSTSSEPGRWRTDRTPYLREIMEELSPMSPTQRVVVIKGTQLGFTEVANNTIAYFIQHAPCPMGMWMPTDALAEKHAKKKLWTMRDSMPILKELVSDRRGGSESTNSTIREWTFPNGSFSIAGSNSGASFRSDSYKVVVLDDVDGFADDVDGEGSPIDLAINRADAFPDRKVYINSTPTIKDMSHIEDEYKNSDQREYEVPCPECDHYQALKWSNFKFEHDGVMLIGDVRYVCESCGCLISESKKTYMFARGKWIPRNPGHKHRGYKLPSFYAPLGRLSWNNIAEQFLRATAKARQGDKRGLKQWTNTRLAESWEEAVDEVDIDDIEKKREYYNCELPDGVLVLTAGIDTQDDRIEFEIVGHGLNKETWGIEYGVIMGDTTQTAVWDQLDAHLQRYWSFDNGRKLGIACGCIDSGGHATTQVYKFCKPREHRRIFAIKGKGGAGLPIVGNISRNNRQRAALFHIGVDTGKELIMSRLRVQHEGAGYCHFPREKEKGYDSEYFKQLTAEKKVVKMVKGVRKIEWVKPSGVRNEALDCRNYAMAALEILNPPLEHLASTGLDVPTQQTVKAATPSGRRRLISKGVG